MVPGCTDGSRMQVLTEKDDFANSSKWYDGWRFMETEMPLTFEAIYENGVLKPAQPLPLKEHDKVRVTIESELTWAERTAGLLQWTGDPQLLRQIAEDDEFGLLESP